MGPRRLLSPLLFYCPLHFGEEASPVACPVPSLLVFVPVLSLFLLSLGRGDACVCGCVCVFV